MRVIAGKLRHRHLVYPENNKDIRPTKDRIREAIFSSLGDIENMTFLDLCAGSGSIGIEAISRGVKKSYFVDNNVASLKYIKENLNSLNIVNQSEIIADDALKALKKFSLESIKFDIVYFDPPYKSDLYDSVIPYILNNNLLNNNGVLVVESDFKLDTNNISNYKIKEYHYGEIYVSVLRKF